MKFTLAHQKLKDDAGNPVSEIQLFKTGDFEHWSGTEFTVDDSFMDNMIANFEALLATSKDGKVIPIDYNHGSLGLGADEAKAAGWIMSIYKKDDGLYAKVEWTEEAAGYIKKGEYRYISPEFGLDPVDEYGQEVEGAFLYAAAMTNRPFLKGMAPLSLSEKKQAERLLNAVKSLVSNKGGEPMKDKIVKLLSLKDAAEDQVIAAVEAINTKLAGLVSALALKDGEDAIEKAKSLIAKAATQETQIGELDKQIKEIKAANVRIEATAKVEKLLSDKVLVPAQREFAIKLAEKDAESFEEYVKTQPKIAQLSDPVGSGKGTETLTDYEEAVKAKMASDSKLDYISAARAVQKENPELAKKHANRSN